MLVYTIVVTYNGAKWVDRCFGSLLGSTLPIKVLAIDNLSIDGTPDMIRHNFPPVTVIETGENLGFGRANNLGLAYAVKEGADFVFLLNQDAWIESETIEKLVAAKTSQFGILTPVHLNGTGDGLDTNFANCLLGSTNPDLVSGLYLEKEGVYEINRANAAAWLLDVDTVKRVGGFDPDYFMYGEDDNFMHRLKYNNLKIGILLSARIYHDRLFRANEVWSSLCREKIAYMTHMKDLNRPLPGQVLHFVGSQGKAILKSVFSLNLQETWTIVVLFFFILLNLPRLASSRKAAQARGAFLPAQPESVNGRLVS